MPSKYLPRLAIAILVVVFLAAVLNVYGISESAGGFAIWNSTEAYFFLNISRRGYHARYLEYPFVVVMESLGAISLPKDGRAFLVVIRVTATGVERRIVTLKDPNDGGGGSDPRKFTPLEGRIWVRYPKLGETVIQNGHLVSETDGLGWWAGDHFEKATPEERRRLDGEKRLTDNDFENDENGWSRRVFVAAPPDRKFTVNVGNRFRLLIDIVGRDRTVSIDLLRPGTAAERIAAFESRHGLISSAKYRRALYDPE